MLTLNKFRQNIPPPSPPVCSVTYSGSVGIWSDAELANKLPRNKHDSTIIDVILSLLIQFGILDQRNQFVSQIWLSIRNVMEPIYSRIRSFLPKTIGFDLAPAVLLFGIFAIEIIIKNNFY